MYRNSTSSKCCSSVDRRCFFSHQKMHVDLITIQLLARRRQRDIIVSDAANISAVFRAHVNFWIQPLLNSNSYIQWVPLFQQGLSSFSYPYTRTSIKKNL